MSSEPQWPEWDGYHEALCIDLQRDNEALSKIIKSRDAEISELKKELKKARRQLSKQGNKFNQAMKAMPIQV
jgi:predicted RNase H-like nuclease (RuvC/YqgF family)